MTNEIEKNLENFKKKGFFIKKNFFTKKEISKFYNAINSIYKKKNINKNILRYFEPSIFNKNKEILIRAENFFKKDRVITELIYNKKINYYLKKLFNEKPILFKEKINFKPPGCRGELLHQDSQAGWNKFTDRFINVLISIEKSDVSNGCLQFDISGNNCSKLIKKKMSPLKLLELKKPKLENFEMMEGDVIFFNNYIPHKSLANKSKKSRMQVYLTYNAFSDGNFREEYFRQKRVSFPPNNERIKGIRYKYKV